MKKALRIMFILLVLTGGFLYIVKNPELPISQNILTTLGIDMSTDEGTGVDLTNCLSYFDGCNTCMVSGGVIGGCTKMFCQEPAEPQCLEQVWTGMDLSGCISYFDGCNNCTVENGRPNACTEMYCETPSEPKCNEYASGEMGSTDTDLLSGMVILPQNIKFFKNFPGLTNRTITYTNPNAQKPMGNNVLDLFLTFTGNNITTIAGSVLEEGGIKFSVEDINALDTKEIIINGVVKNDTQIIEAIWDGDKQIRTIKGFTPGTKDFSFRISQNNNVAPGMNTYLIRAYAKDKVYYGFIRLNYFTAQQSFFGEKISTTPTPKNYWEHLPKMTKVAACQEKDGIHEYDLESKRPGKNTMVGGFYKNKNILYYAVRASSSDTPSCEDSDFEISLFTYNCKTKKSNELLTYGGLATEGEKGGGACYLDVIAGTDNSIVTKLSHYESASPATIFDITTKTMKEIKPFEYTNGSQLKKNILSIQEKYSLTSDGMEFVTFADTFSFRNCNENLVCDIVYERYIDETHSLTYKTKIDIINKTVQ